MRRLRVPRPGFVGTFALLSAAAVALLGLVLARVEASHERSTAQTDAASSAQLLVQVGLQPHIQRSDMDAGLRAATIRELDRAFQAGLADGQLVRIKLWSPDGEVLYSDQHSLIGQRFPIEDDLQESLDGELTAEVSHLDKAENVDERQFGELLEVYVPVQFGTEHVGAFEIYVPWEPIAGQIQTNTRRLLLVLVGGLALLWAVLFRIVVGASRRIRRDRDELARRADENQRLAMFDHLTGLPNRLLFFDRVSQTVATSAREGSGVAVLLLDLHHFKDVNDTLGHERGDELLRQVGPRLEGVLRASDTVARLGGDEFGIALAGLGTSTEAEDVARKLTDALDAPFAIDGIDIALGGSIGIATYPDHGDQPDQLLRRAEVAMYVAKAARAPFESYAPAQDTYSTDRLALVADLRKAIDDATLSVAYQPMIDLSRETIVGVEALLRWTHPTQGPIGPDVFIPLAEHSGLIGRVTTYVLEAATEQAHAWREAGLDLTVSVNLSVRDLQRPGLAATVAGTLRAHDVPADRLRLEITEGSVMDQPDRALATLQELRRRGRAVGRRLRNRVLLARLPATAPGQRAQDRSLVRPRPRPERIGRRDRPVDGRARPQPGSFDRRRGRRGRVVAELPA